MTALHDGSLTGFAKIARDLTARQQSEGELHERRKDLETAVQARTLELSQANETLQHEVGERRGAEERIKDLLRTIITAQRARPRLDRLGERAALIGGTAEIESPHGGGTTIYVRVPLPESRNDG